MDRRIIIGRFRRWLLNMIYPVTQWVGRRHMPFSKKRISGDDFCELAELYRPGMIFLTRTNGELSNLVNPGFWKHGAMYVGDGKVVEALGQGVVQTNIIDFIMKKDYIALLTPLFADAVEMERAAIYARSLLGTPYDFGFEFGDKAFYCYEVIYRSYKEVIPDMPFKPKTDAFGIPVIVGDDFYDADTKWQCLYDSAT